MNINDEVWKVVDEFPNYMVSNYGKVKNCKRNKILKPKDNQRGYLIVNLYNNGKQKHKYIHQLVANAFLENPNNLKEVDHQNGDKY